MLIQCFMGPPLYISSCTVQVIKAGHGIFFYFFPHLDLFISNDTCYHESGYLYLGLSVQ